MRSELYFLWIQKAALGTISCRPTAPSVLHWHGVSVWWKCPFLEAWEVKPLWVQKATLGTTSCRPQTPSIVHCCFSVAEGCLFGSLGHHFGASLLWIQKAKLGMISNRPKAPPILHRHIGQIHVPHGAIGLQGLKGTQYINDESTTPRRKEIKKLGSPLITKRKAWLDHHQQQN